ncbi:MAG: PAS domain S-box protein, partial [Bacteroidales bacterium]|nr:PAS domain S-box protein [Bacteroidales bacterium]
YLQNKKSVELLKKSQQRLLAAQRIAGMGDFTWDLKTGHVQWSEAMYELLGYDRNEEINFEKVNADIHHPDDLESVTEWLNQCIESGEEYHEPKEYRVVRKDGEALQIQTHVRVKYENDRAVELFGALQDITKRKLAEKALWESRENFRVTLHSIGDAVIATDTNSCITTMNTVAEKLTGWKFEEAKGRNIQEIFTIFHAKTGSVVDNPVGKVLKTGHIVRLADHVRLLAKNGKEYQIADSGAPIVDKNKNVIGVVLVFRDVSEQYRITEALKVGEEKYRSVFENTGTASCIIEKDGTISLVNSRFVQLSGYSAGEIENHKTWMEFVVPEDLQRMRQQHDLRRENREEALKEYEFRFVDKQHSIRHIHLFIDVIPGTEKSVASLLEITERKETEMAIRNSEARFKSVFESANVGKSITMPTGEINVNKAFCNMLGYKADELKNKKWQDITPPDEIESIESMIEPLHKGVKDSARFEKRYIHKNGEFIWADVSVAMFRDADRKPLYFLTTAVDITERKRAEMSLQREKEWSENIVNNAPNIIVGLGEKSEIKVFNHYAERLTGYKAEEVIGKKWIGIFIQEEMRETIYRVWAEIVENRLIDHHFENEIITKSGEKRLIEWNNTILTEDDEFRMILSLGEDITDRKNAEEKLAQSHELMSYIIENTNSAVAVHDRDLRYIYVSQRYLDEYEISGKDVIGKHHYEVFPDLPEKWREIHRRALRGEVLGADRDPYHRADGSVVWTRWECRPWYEYEDKIGGIIVYTEVITKQIETEIKLREYNKKLEQAEENARLGSWEVDLKTGKTWWTKQMFKLLGFEPSDNAPGFDEYLEHIHPADQEKVSVVLDNLKKGVITTSMEYRVNPDFTGQRYLLSRAEGVKDQTAKLIKVTGTLLDITEQKLIENEINRLKENLEGQVKEKTIELQERIDELERYRDATVEREFRMKELREEIKRLKKEEDD